MENETPYLPQTEKLLLSYLVHHPEAIRPELVDQRLYMTPAYALLAADLLPYAGERMKEQSLMMAIAAKWEAEPGKEKLQAIGGHAGLMDLTVHSPIGVSARTLTEWREQLEDAAERREAITSARAIMDAAGNMQVPMQTVRSMAGQLVATRENVEIFPRKNGVILQYLSMLEKKIRQRSNITGLKSGYLLLDNMLGGFQPATLTVLGARPSMGKTAWGLNVAYQVARRLEEGQGDVVFLTAEMTPTAIMGRLLSIISAVDTKQTVLDGMSKEDMQRIREAVKKLENMPLIVMDGCGREMDELCQMLTQRHMTCPVAMLVVDYLQLLRCSRLEEQGRYAVVSAISRKLAELAHQLNIPVLALAQLSRESAKAKDKTPALTDLRESGAIEQDADVVMLLHRPDYYKQLASEDDADTAPAANDKLAKVIVAKNRDGETGVAWFSWQPSILTFTPVYRL